MADALRKHRTKNRRIVIVLAVLALLLAFACLFAGPSRMSVSESLDALLKRGSSAQVRILWNIRIPRVLAAVVAGAVTPSPRGERSRQSARG